MLLHFSVMYLLSLSSYFYQCPIRVIGFAEAYRNFFFSRGDAMGRIQGKRNDILAFSDNRSAEHAFEHVHTAGCGVPFLNVLSIFMHAVLFASALHVSQVVANGAVLSACGPCAAWEP